MTEMMTNRDEKPSSGKPKPSHERSSTAPIISGFVAPANTPVSKKLPQTSGLDVDGLRHLARALEKSNVYDDDRGPEENDAENGRTRFSMEVHPLHAWLD